ncbi:hypothetical protein PM082_021902 [Marasmius tenuissimus]|nr:hypothetical protein PM082_021902 [Marasmius tenuissimus]
MLLSRPTATTSKLSPSTNEVCIHTVSVSLKLFPIAQESRSSSCAHSYSGHEAPLQKSNSQGESLLMILQYISMVRSAGPPRSQTILPLFLQAPTSSQRGEGERLSSLCSVSIDRRSWQRLSSQPGWHLKQDSLSGVESSAKYVVKMEPRNGVAAEDGWVVTSTNFQMRNDSGYIGN